MSQELTPDIRAFLGMPTEAEEKGQREETDAHFAAKIDALAERVNEAETAERLCRPTAASYAAPDGLYLAVDVLCTALDKRGDPRDAELAHRIRDAVRDWMDRVESAV